MPSQTCTWKTFLRYEEFNTIAPSTVTLMQIAPTQKEKVKNHNLFRTNTKQNKIYTFEYYLLH